MTVTIPATEFMDRVEASKRVAVKQIKANLFALFNTVMLVGVIMRLS